MTTQPTAAPANSGLPAPLRHRAAPGIVAVLVAGCFAWASLVRPGEATPLPTLVTAVAFLLVIIFEDVRRFRIPNAVTLPALLAALGLAAATDGSPDFLQACGGAALALGVFLAPFALGWFGAGDVKAMVVLGALFGGERMLGIAWWMLIAGGLLAIALVASQPGGLVDLARRWGRTLWVSLRLRRLFYFAPEGGAAATGMPCAVAIGLGASLFQLWGVPWS